MAQRARRGDSGVSACSPEAWLKGEMLRPSMALRSARGTSGGGAVWNILIIMYHSVELLLHGGAEACEANISSSWKQSERSLYR